MHLRIYATLLFVRCSCAKVLNIFFVCFSLLLNRGDSEMGNGETLPWTDLFLGCFQNPTCLSCTTPGSSSPCPPPSCSLSSSLRCIIKSTHRRHCSFAHESGMVVGSSVFLPDKDVFILYWLQNCVSICVSSSMLSL